MSLTDIMPDAGQRLPHTLRGKLAIPAESTLKEVKWATVCVDRWTRILRWSHTIAVGVGVAGTIYVMHFSSPAQKMNETHIADSKVNAPTTVTSQVPK